MNSRSFNLYCDYYNSGLSAGTGKLCIFGPLGLVFIWSCFVSCLLLLLYYVICAPVLTEGTYNSLTLSNADELFRSRIPNNHIHVQKEKEDFVVPCLRPPENTILRAVYVIPE